MKLKIIIIFFALLLPLFVQAQERLVGLHGNPVIEQFLQRSHNSDMMLKSQKAMTFSPLWLPFFDDFTYDGPYPDEARWEDKFAFVNSSFQKNPANRGVATLDALDAEGRIYAHASPYSFMADYLTTRPIRTDSVVINEEYRRLTPSDSLYLSFYYQPQGMGDAPNRHDSLVLEFFMEYADTTIMIDSIFHPADTIWNIDDPQTWDTIYEAYWEYKTDTIIFPEQWKHIWSSPGMSIDTFYARHKRWMAQVMIPITDMAYFRPDFRFRFRNYASLPNNTLPSWQSNMDQWNIDYVYLNHNRFRLDTTYPDISFVNPGESFIKDFAAMPYRQYAADPYNSMKTRFTTAFTNLDNVNRNATYKYRIYDPDGNQIGTDERYDRVDWTNVIRPTKDSVQYLDRDVVLMFPSKPRVFSIKQTLIGDVGADNRLSDSVTFLQQFENYFAYDDGTPEVGYGLTPAKAMMAVRFPLNTFDTLQAVDIFFNTTPTRQTAGHIEYFKLMVWNDRHGEPGDTLYTNEEVLFSGEAGKFIRFPINRVVLLSSGFFVGLQQSTADNMNLGFDYSNNMSSRNMYKIYNDPWKTSYYQGSIMIRPVMGTPLNLAPLPLKTPSPNNMTVFPNPLTSGQQVYIQKPDSFGDEDEITLKIYDGIGKQCYEAPYTQPEVTLENVYNGVFIIKLYNQTTGKTATTKLMITH
jgi:hypothetical protein